jgi:hypothetical protein
MKTIPKIMLGISTKTIAMARLFISNILRPAETYCINCPVAAPPNIKVTAVKRICAPISRLCFSRFAFLKYFTSMRNVTEGI